MQGGQYFRLSQTVTPNERINQLLVVERVRNIKMESDQGENFDLLIKSLMNYSYTYCR